MENKSKNAFLKEFEKDLGYYFSGVFGAPLAKPHWVFISVSHRCNFNCQMCGVKKILKGQELELEVIGDILKEVAAWDADCVVLLTGGEPFLRPDIFDVIGRAASLGLQTEVVTNGSLMDASMAEKIIASGLKNIAVSLDGASARTHDFIRGVAGAHEKAVAALGHLAEAKKKRGAGPQISAWTTIMKENVRELSGIIPLARGAGVECLVYHPVIVCQDDMQNTIGDGSFWITKDDVPILRREIDAIVAYQKKHGLVAFLHDPSLWIDYFSGTLTKNEWACNPFVFIDVGPDGEVRSCGPSFGNVKKSGLADCLKTSLAQGARERMRRCAKPCLQTCWSWPEADSLDSAVKKFLSGITGSSLGNNEKKRLIERGIVLLDEFEERVSRKSELSRQA